MVKAMRGLIGLALVLAVVVFGCLWLGHISVAYAGDSAAHVVRSMVVVTMGGN